MPLATDPEQVVHVELPIVDGDGSPHVLVRAGSSRDWRRWCDEWAALCGEKVDASWMDQVWSFMAQMIKGYVEPGTGKAVRFASTADAETWIGDTFSVGDLLKIGFGLPSWVGLSEIDRKNSQRQSPGVGAASAGSASQDAA